MTRVLIAEDWYADRIRFSLLLSANDFDIHFAWRAGRSDNAGMWGIEQVVTAIPDYDVVLLDLAWTTQDERLAVKLCQRGIDAIEPEWKHLSGIQVLDTLHAAKMHDELRRCVVVSAYAQDSIRERCIKTYKVDTFLKWKNEKGLVSKVARLARQRTG